MNRFIISLCLLCIGTASGLAITITRTDVEKSLEQLDKEIAKRSEYIRARESRIDSIRHRLTDNIPGGRQLELTMQMGDLFSSFNNDSALVYYTRGYDKSLEIGDSINAFRFRAKRATMMPLSGFVMDAVNEYEAINASALPPQEIPFYHTSGRQMYSYISSLFTNYPDTRNFWNQKVIAHRDSLLNVLDHKSLTYDLYYGEDLIEKGDYKRAKVILLELLDHITPNSNLYARACHMLATIAREKGTGRRRHTIWLSPLWQILKGRSER